MAERVSDAASPEIERAKQIFRFLKAFAERNVPLQRRLADQPWGLVFSDLPRHPQIVVGEVHLAADESGNTMIPGAESLLCVGRPTLTRSPRPPAQLLEWLQPGWEDPNGRVEALRERNERRGAETVTVSFEEASDRTDALDAWRAVWDRWAEAERPARATMRVFERLYELKGRIDLDSERVELILGDGRLVWQRPDGVIDHPVLLQRVELEFDADVPEFRVIDADRAAEVYGALLQGGDGINAQELNELRTELEAGAYHPLSKAGTSGYLRRLVQLLSPRGTFREDRGAVAPGVDPVIQRDPALFLRTRLSGFPAAFDRVLEDLETRRTLPVSLTRLVGVVPPAADRQPVPVASPWSEPPDVLLSKPANPEQIEIARALDAHRAVLVQGPPGTGKSHTIANMIGHLVAQGKRVLVTSHTTKALRVLRDQVVGPLQPLCVAVLEHDLDARTQMEQSVRGILARLTTAREETLEREISALTEMRAGLIGEIERITANLRAAREAEYLSIVVAGESVAPADAARWVRDARRGNDWVPSPVETGAPLPLEPQELAEIYGSSGVLVEQEEQEIEGELPELGALPSLALLFRNKWKTVIRSCLVNGHRPSKVDHFRAIGLHVRLEEGRRKLGVRWARHAQPAGLPAFASIGATPEPILREYVEQFDGLLVWWTARWAVIATAAEQVGFQWGTFRDREVARSTPATPFERDAAIIGEALQPVDRLGIAAVGAPAHVLGAEQANAFREMVVRRAWEIMREQGWLS